MIIAEKTKEKVVQSHDFAQVNCTIDAEDMRYVASLLRNNYSNTQLAVVREISANALDANKEANSTRPIEIKLPTKLNPTFSVRDFGGGLSEEDVFGLYSKYGKSTKRESNNYIGAFGIGKFAPLSYGDNFTCVSYHGGMKKSYNVFVNDDDDTKIAKLFEEPSNEPTGLSIEVAVADGDLTNFREIVMKFFRFFDDAEMPKFIGFEEGESVVKPKNSLESDKGNWFVTEDNDHNYYYNRKAHVIMGRVVYPLDPEAINVDNFISNDKSRRVVKEIIREGNFYLRMPIGSVKLHHSREALEYNKSTQKALCRALFVASQDILEIAKLKLADSADLFEAKVNHARIVNSLNHSLRNLFDNAFEWNGIKIDNARFNREYDKHDDLILTQMSRDKDDDSRNGYRVKSAKVSSIYCQDDAIFMVQNIASSHGNNLRARTIFNENEDINQVYVIYPATQEGWRYLNDEWNFNLIGDEHKLFSDNVEKEKPVRNNVSGGKSRASIPLFKMKHDTRYLHRNADYWANCDNPINSLEADEIEGSVEGKLIYVPITRFTIDQDLVEGWDLDRVASTAKFIRKEAEEDSELSKFTIMGVRKGDVKKLGDNWISWVDFLTDHYKQIIEDNMADMTDCYIRNSINSAEHQKTTKIVDVLNAHNGVLICDQIDCSNLADDHLFLTMRSYKRVMDSARIDNHYNKLKFVAHHDAEWLNEKFSSVKVDIDDIISIVEKFVSNYPHLSMLDDTYHYYNKRAHHTHGDMTIKIQDYISLCDSQRGEGE